MPVDIIFLVFIAFAVYKGFTRGLIVGVFSFVAYFIGLAAALKLSSGVARYLSEKDAAPSVWLPVVSFIVVLIAVILLVNLAARLIRSLLKLSALGWADKLGGILFFLMINIFIFSILLFYASETGWISESVKKDSKIFPYTITVAPAMIGLLGKILPVFANLFEDLKDFFAGLNTKI